MEWRFKKIEKGDTKQNPAYRELFRNDDLNTIVKALVREDIQNRLDAHNPQSSPMTHIRYFFPTKDKYLPKDVARPYLLGIAEHIGTRDILKEIGCEYDFFDFEQPMSFLTIECFNTTGLKGDPLATRDPDESAAERNDFYWFWRNVGRSKKESGERGSWGLGKIVYHAASGIRSFLAYNVRANDYEQTIFGRSVLAIHKLGEDEYVPDGYYGVFPETAFPAYAIPARDENEITKFKKDFLISRHAKQPGLSIVIPFPESAITYDDILKNVIEHYFWEIICGRLEVEVEYGTQKTCLTQESLSNTIAQLKYEDDSDQKKIVQKVTFCEQIYRINYRTHGGLYKLSLPPRYVLSGIEHLFQTQQLYEEARSKYQKGELVGVEVTVSIPLRNREEMEGCFWVFLQRDSNLEKPDETFIRDGLTIIGERHVRLNEKVHSLTIAEKYISGIISKFLGDAENPAHTKWCSADEHFKERYGKGALTRLKYIQRFGDSLNSLLGRVENERFEKLLEDIFYLPKEAPDSLQKGKPRPDSKPDIPQILSKPKAFSIERLFSPAGFCIQSEPDAENPPIKLTMKMAYEFEGEGNPLNKHHPADFNLCDKRTKIVVDLKGCDEMSRTPNSLTVKIHSPDYRIELRGFDSNRDLLTNIRPVYAEITLEEDEQ